MLLCWRCLFSRRLATTKAPQLPFISLYLEPGAKELRSHRWVFIRVESNCILLVILWRHGLLLDQSCRSLGFPWKLVCIKMQKLLFPLTNSLFFLSRFPLIDRLSDEGVVAWSRSSWRDSYPFLSVPDWDGSRPPFASQSIHASPKKQGKMCVQTVLFSPHLFNGKNLN